MRESYGVGGTALLGLAARKWNIPSCQKYYAKTNFSCHTERVTFIIDGKGIIRDTENSSISMKAHSRLVEKWIPTIKKELEASGTQASNISGSPTATLPSSTAPTATATSTASAPAPEARA